MWACIPDRQDEISVFIERITNSLKQVEKSKETHTDERTGVEDRDRFRREVGMTLNRSAFLTI
jgi:hypothetical protein